MHVFQYSKEDKTRSRLNLTLTNSGTNFDFTSQNYQLLVINL